MKQKLFVLLAVLALFFSQIACEGTENPNPSNPLISPVTEVEQGIMNLIQPEQKNTLSNP